MAEKVADNRRRNPDRVAEQLKKSQQKRKELYRTDSTYRASRLAARKTQYEKYKSTDLPRLRKIQRRNLLVTKYRMTPEDFDRMLDEQNGSCACCGRVPKKFVVDHDHATGKVRGLLCNTCNVGIGHMQDTVNGLQLGIDYLSGVKHVVA